VYVEYLINTNEVREGVYECTHVYTNGLCVWTSNLQYICHCTCRSQCSNYIPVIEVVMFVCVYITTAKPRSNYM